MLVGNTYDGSNLTAITNPTGKQDSTAIGWHYAPGTTTVEFPIIGTVQFSSTNYWYDSTNDALKSGYGSSYPAWVYDDNSIVKGYVDTYKGILEGLGASIIEARIIKIEELDYLYNYYSNTTGQTLPFGSITSLVPSWLYNTTYWTGSAYDHSYGIVWRVDSNGVFARGGYNDDSYGVRPVIVINASDL